MLIYPYGDWCDHILHCPYNPSHVCIGWDTLRRRMHRQSSTNCFRQRRRASSQTHQNIHSLENPLSSLIIGEGAWAFRLRFRWSSLILPYVHNTRLDNRNTLITSSFPKTALETDSHAGSVWRPYRRSKGPSPLGLTMRLFGVGASYCPGL